MSSKADIHVPHGSTDGEIPKKTLTSIDAALRYTDAGGTLRVTTTDDDSGDDVGTGVVYVLAVRSK